MLPAYRWTVVSNVWSWPRAASAAPAEAPTRPLSTLRNERKHVIPIDYSEGRSPNCQCRAIRVTKPISFAANPDKQVAVSFEPEDLGKFMKVLESPATAEAMAFDGVKKETVKVFVLDKEFKV